jgi:CheY-like chemotaxis protein
MVAARAPLRVLVVDDDEDIRDVLVVMVTRFGHVADRACDGLEAIHALAEQAYDVVLLDLMMPRMAGDDVLRWLQQHPELGRDLRVVVATGSAEEHRARLEDLGADAVVAKPLGLQELRDVLGGSEP